MTASAPRNHPAEDAHPAPTPAPGAVPEGGWRAQEAEERGQGICRTCAEPIWNEGGTVGHRKREEGWSDRIERGGDSLVCFKAVEYRHVPLAGREAYIYDLALDRGHRTAEADFAADPVKAVPDPCPTCGRDRYDTPFGPHAEGYGFCPESFHFRPRPEPVVAPLPSEARQVIDRMLDSIDQCAHDLVDRHLAPIVNEFSPYGEDRAKFFAVHNAIGVGPSLKSATTVIRGHLDRLVPEDDEERPCLCGTSGAADGWCPAHGGALAREATLAQHIRRLAARLPEDDKDTVRVPSIADTCCGKCPGACYVDQVTEA